VLSDLVLAVTVATPVPSPSADFDPNVITPGPLGFAAIALVTIAVLFLILDMVRRIRRVRYREEVREQIRREQETTDGDPRPDGDGTAR
jgi:hypothetical protein